MLGPTTIPTQSVDYNFTKGKWSINMNAGDDSTKLKVLSQPRVISVENQKSQIKISKKQPYANGSTSVQNGTGTEGKSTTTTTTTEEVGIDLTITPRINKEMDVTLELKLKITSIVDSTLWPLGLMPRGKL